MKTPDGTRKGVMDLERLRKWSDQDVEVYGKGGRHIYSGGLYIDPNTDKPKVTQEHEDVPLESGQSVAFARGEPLCTGDLAEVTGYIEELGWPLETGRGLRFDLERSQVVYIYRGDEHIGMLVRRENPGPDIPGEDYQFTVYRVDRRRWRVRLEE